MGHVGCYSAEVGASHYVYRQSARLLCKNTRQQLDRALLRLTALSLDNYVTLGDAAFSTLLRFF